MPFLQVLAQARFEVIAEATQVHRIDAPVHVAEAVGRTHDSVGVGSYRIDLHPSTVPRTYVDISSWPFQIPLGSLIPQRVENLLPANKNLGTTHITNGCYRMHPTEWLAGEVTGTLAAAAIEDGVPPRAIRADPGRLARFQGRLEADGVELRWPDAVLRGFRP